MRPKHLHAFEMAFESFQRNMQAMAQKENTTQTNTLYLFPQTEHWNIAKLQIVFLAFELPSISEICTTQLKIHVKTVMFCTTKGILL